MIHLYVTYRPMVLDRMRPDVGTFSCASAHCINLRICFGFSIGVNSAITSGASDGFELCRVFKQIILTIRSLVLTNQIPVILKVNKLSFVGSLTYRPILIHMP